VRNCQLLKESVLATRNPSTVRETIRMVQTATQPYRPVQSGFDILFLWHFLTTWPVDNIAIHPTPSLPACVKHVYSFLLSIMPSDCNCNLYKYSTFNTWYSWTPNRQNSLQVGCKNLHKNLYSTACNVSENMTPIPPLNPQHKVTLQYV